MAVTTVKMLHRIGIENVERASEGGEAVEMFTRARAEGRPFHLLVLDLTVRGGMGGVETLQKISDGTIALPGLSRESL